MAVIGSDRPSVCISSLSSFEVEVVTMGTWNAGLRFLVMRGRGGAGAGLRGCSP